MEHRTKACSRFEKLQAELSDGTETCPIQLQVFGGNPDESIEQSSWLQAAERFGRISDTSNSEQAFGFVFDWLCFPCDAIHPSFVNNQQIEGRVTIDRDMATW
jgi:hypothetical protein